MAKQGADGTTKRAQGRGAGGPRLTPRILLLALLAVAVVTGVALGALEWARVASADTGPSGLDDALRAQLALEEQRRRGAELDARLLAENPDLETLLVLLEDPEIDEEAREGALVELETLLEDALATSDLALAVVESPTGIELARAGGEGLAPGLVAPVAARARERRAASGVVAGESPAALHLVAAARVEREFEPLGTVAVASPYDLARALEIERASRAETAFLAADGTAVVASSLEAGGAGVAAALDEGVAAVRSGAERSEPATVELGGVRHEARVTPLAGPGGGVAGLLVTLVELPSSSGAFRIAQLAVLLAALGALVLALLGAPWIARSAAGPVRRMAAAAQAARAGDLAGAARAGVPPDLAAFFADLAEKRELEQVASRVPLRGEPVAVGGQDGDSATRTEAFVVLVDMPRYARVSGDDEPREVLERLERDRARVRRVVDERGGRLEASLGHRILASFDGEGAGRAALGAAAEVARRLAEPENAFDEPVPPVVAVASGRTILGGSADARAVIGLAVQQAESLLRESTPGDLVLARGAWKALGSEIDAAGEAPVTPRKSLLSPLPLYAVDPGRAAATAGSGSASGGTSGASGAGSGALAGFAPGAVFADRFELLERISGGVGPGESGLLFRARDRHGRGVVALRLLRRELLGDLAGLEGLDSELRAAVRVSHPSVAQVVDIGLEDGVPFVASEWVEGAPVARVVAQAGVLPGPAGLRLARHVAAGLAAMHRADLAHGSLRSAAVLVEPRGEARVVELGIAPLFPPPGADPAADQALAPPRFLAPERLQGGGPSPTADVWAAGMVIAECFAGGPLYPRGTWDEERDHVLAGPPDNSRLGALPEGLGPILGRCLAREPGGRYPSAVELLEALALVRA